MVNLGSVPGLGRSPGEENTHSSILAWETLWTEEPEIFNFGASLVAQLVKNPPATHFSILAWQVPWTVQSMGLQRAGHD